MGQGKSLELMRQAHTLSEKGRWNVVVGKPRSDEKAGGNIESRFGDGAQTTRRSVDVLIGPDDDARQLILAALARTAERAQSFAAIIDEAQFLSRTHIDQLRQLVDEDNVSVWAYGLRTDFQKNLFEGSERLFALADSAIDLSTISPELAICEGFAAEPCERKAIFNTRLVDDEYIFTGAQKAIDQEHTDAPQTVGKTTYRALCSSCYRAAESASHHPHPTGEE